MGECIEGLPDREAAYLALEAVEALIEDAAFSRRLRNLALKKRFFGTG